MEEKKASHKRCFIEECTRQAWKKGMCYKHFHATGGQDNPDKKEKKTKKQAGRTVSRVAHNHEKAGSTPAPATRTKESRGYLIDTLEAKREELARELAAINTTILTLEKYGA